MTNKAIELMPEIQAELNVSKGREVTNNNRVMYTYRNADDILKALKPLMKVYKFSVLLNDKIELIGERYYLVSTAKATFEDGSFMEATAQAREPQKMMSMSEGQVTGATSSYSRKSALGALFALDDGRDIDDEEPPQPIGEGQVTDLNAMIEKLDEEEIVGFQVWMHDSLGVDDISELTLDNVRTVEGALKKKLKLKAESK